MTESNGKLDLLHNLMHGSLDYETAESMQKESELKVYGFVKDSEMYNAITELNISIYEMQSDNLQGDLFYTPIERYEIDYGKFWEMFPFKLGGGTIADESDEGCYGMPIAYDEQDVMFECPRGLCAISREMWADGWRHCPGC